MRLGGQMWAVWTQSAKMKRIIVGRSVSFTVRRLTEKNALVMTAEKQKATWNLHSIRERRIFSVGNRKILFSFGEHALLLSEQEETETAEHTTIKYWFRSTVLPWNYFFLEVSKIALIKGNELTTLILVNHLVMKTFSYQPNWNLEIHFFNGWTQLGFTSIAFFRKEIMHRSWRQISLDLKYVDCFAQASMCKSFLSVNFIRSTRLELYSFSLRSKFFIKLRKQWLLSFGFLFKLELQSLVYCIWCQFDYTMAEVSIDSKQAAENEIQGSTVMKCFLSLSGSNISCFGFFKAQTNAAETLNVPVKNAKFVLNHHSFDNLLHHFSGASACVLEYFWASFYSCAPLSPQSLFQQFY